MYMKHVTSYVISLRPHLHIFTHNVVFLIGINDNERLVNSL